MKLHYWNGFSKRKNSTKQPTAASATQIDVYWKEDTSIDKPSVILSGNTITIDYCYIPDWGKYYFVSAITVLTNGTTQYDLDEDVLATHKTGIGSTVARIDYAATGWNKEIPDTRMAVEGGNLMYRTAASVGLSSSGCYILGTISDTSAGKIGAVNYYVVQEAAMRNLMNMMNDTNFLQDIEVYFNGSWLDLIVSCIWIPLGYVTAGSLFGGTGLEPVYMGKKDTGIVGYAINTALVEVSNTQISIPFKWQDFRDCQPYTSASLYLPGIGITDLNINDFYESNNVSIITRMDATTGDITYKIFNDSGTELKTIVFAGGAQIALAHVTSNIGGAMAGIGGTIGGFVGVGISAATGNVLGVVGSGAGLIAGASSTMLAFNQRSTSIKGSNTGRSSYYDSSAVLILVCKRTEDIDNATYISRNGRPVAQTHAINNHSGYVQCSNASISIAGDEYERETINSYLNSGFYYE